MSQTLPPPTPVDSKALPPIQARDLPPRPPADLRTASAATPSVLRIQAGSFASEANAEQAVSRLSPAGAAVIEAIQRDGATLYRVMLPAPDDEPQAYALRDRVAGLGFADARVVTAR